MSIRPAKFEDIPELLSLGKEMHGRSIYAESCTMDEPLFKNICFESIRSGVKCLFVSKTDGGIDGFVIGCLDRVYGIGKQQYATDLFFYVRESAHARVAGKLLDAFKDWAERQNVVEIYCGISDAIGNPERTEKLYLRRGFRRAGLMMVKEITQ